MEVDFITLGDASERLKVPAPTLRNWTDQLEEFNVHFVKRNNRNERIYYDSDLKIFEYVRDLKQEHGRRTTMKDLASMIADMGDRFDLRSEEEAPVPQPSNKTSELINVDDFQRLMENQRVRALVGYMIGESTKHIREQLVEELQTKFIEDRETLKEALREEIRLELQDKNKLIEELRQEMMESQKQIQTDFQQLSEEQSKRDEVQKEIQVNTSELRELLIQRKKELENSKPKGFLGRLFGGNK
jgi:hypothetical protein